MRCRAIRLGVAALMVSFTQPPPSRAADCVGTRYDCAVFYVEHQNFQAAIRSLNEELRESPQNLKALNLLGIALTGTGQTEKANSKFREALRVNPRFFPARKNLAVNEFNLNRAAEAEAEFSRVLKDAPKDDIAHVYLGEIAFQKNDFATALEHYEIARGRIAQNPPWILHYAQCLAARNDTKRANDVLRSLPADNAEDRFEAGVILGRAGAYTEAAELFGSAREKYSDPYVAAYNQLLMLVQAGHYPAAIGLFDELVTHGYQRAELYNLVSEAYVKSGRVQQAYDVLRTATGIEPEAEDNYVDLAALCLEYEEYSLGMEILDVGIHYIPNSYRLYIQRGVTLVMKGSIEEAEKDFQTASRLAPDKSLPYFALGEVWMQSGQSEKAVSVLRERSKIPGVDFIIPYVFAVALIHAGAEPGTPSLDEAVRALELSVHLNSGFSHSHAELGKLLFKEGQIDRAIAELKAASALDPEDAGPVYVLSQAYRKQGRKTESDELLSRVAQLHSQEHKLDMKRELKRLVKQDTSSSTQMQATP